ncbi:stage II sporulation protein R [Neobacillus ginsengisoli]|uniref:Stage II sporulation protein R n=1 Tax=Neobacillus ginsengisoli TaxID=904295 RepID=A0ABT9Y166_9BACI|nr:stage II sporulation protein R [Neobacillus ginsengisoli]MDQ0200879.1 stage II sporulation protein R [Neobacillus ginsengisoli]
MKSKTLVWAYLLILSLGTILSLYIPKDQAIAKEEVVIPGDAIRLRILANSDTGSDQALKRQVRDAVNAKISLWVKDLTSLNKAKTVIKSKLPEIQAIAETTVRDRGSNQKVNVKFGKVQFPTKLYGEFLYPAGDYQAILITLGKGEGANWWCVLYPPLCFLDFSNGVAVSDGFEDSHKAKAETVSEAEANSVNEDTASVAEANSINEGAASVADASSDDTQATEKSSTVQAQEKVDDTELQVASAKNAAQDNSDQQEKPANKVLQKQHIAKKAAPVYTAEDEQPVKVKFFIVELFQKLFE